MKKIFLPFKSTWLRTIALMLLLSFGFSVYSQPGKEKVETMRVGFLTRKMNLNPEEAKVFWPVYNQYQAELTGLRTERKKARKEANEDFANWTDAEVGKFLDDEMAMRDQELSIQKKYHTRFKQVLPIKKVALLYKSEEEFKRFLIEKLQEQRGKQN